MPSFECNSMLCAANIENYDCTEYYNSSVKEVHAFGNANGKLMLTSVARTAVIKIVDGLFRENKKSKME